VTNLTTSNVSFKASFGFAANNDEFIDVNAADAPRMPMANAVERVLVKGAVFKLLAADRRASRGFFSLSVILENRTGRNQSRYVFTSVNRTGNVTLNIDGGRVSYLVTHGLLLPAAANDVNHGELSSGQLDPPAHLRDHVITVSLKNNPSVRINVTYTTHCWTRRFNAGSDMKDTILDEKSYLRTLCKDRLVASEGLPSIMSTLAARPIRRTEVDGVYSTQVRRPKGNKGGWYSAYFTVSANPDPDRFSEFGYVVRVVSAYERPSQAAVNVLLSALLFRADPKPLQILENARE
jgi:hypothetical protein